MNLYRRHLRLWAARMLFVWLFCAGVGMANACLSTAPLGHGDEHAAAGDTAAVAHHADAAPHDAAALEDQAVTASAQCQQFCDRAAVSVPTAKAALDDLQAQALAPQGQASVLPQPALLPAWLPRPCRHGVRAPPITIAFLRLAL